MTHKRITAWILATGSELLSWKVDTNSGQINQSLNLLGIETIGRTIVGDRYDDLLSACRHGLSKADILIVGGGLGPTVDDLTRDALAKATGIPLVHDDEVLEAIRARFRLRGIEMPATNVVQAMVPAVWQGSRELRKNGRFINANGTAPGLVFDTGGKLAIALPGPPRELIPMLEGQAVPCLQRKYSGLALKICKTWNLWLVGESAVDQAMRPVGKAFPDLEISFLAKPGLVDVRLYTTQDRENDPDYVSACQMTESILGQWTYSRSNQSPAEVAGMALLNKRWTISCAESCTGGMLLSALTDIAGSSRYVMGGVVAYDNRIKREQLGVSPAILETHGAVSQECVSTMAQGVCDRFKTDMGVAVSGIAGPGGGTDDKPVGLVWTAICLHGRMTTFSRRFSGDRQRVRDSAVLQLLHDIVKTVD